MESLDERKVDKGLYSSNANDFIPVVCYYNSDTLLTKNGNLVQVIEITGIDSDEISHKLGGLRSAIKSALGAHIMNPDIAFWIHTVRHQTDLDDHHQYKHKFAQDLHDSWVTKNQLRSRFVNTLYISVVSRPKSFYSLNLNEMVDNSFLDTITQIHDSYLNEAAGNLSDTTQQLMTYLADYMPRKLSVKISQDGAYADTLYIYNYIISLKDEKIPLPLQDFSEALASKNYVVGGNKIEVEQDGVKKFAALISVKEYINEDNDNLLEHMMHLPVEFVATEILFHADADHARSQYSHQNYILEVSKDSEVRSAKTLYSMFDDENAKHLTQQLSIMIISDSTKKLDDSTADISKSLSKVGLVNVREDIHLENMFWSQMPGNFKYIKRNVYNTLENACAFVSIQNTPAGSKRSKWGRAVTILPTEKNTPYFVNFHNKYQSGHTCIYGSSGMGKSMLMNFLLSEATKYDPTIVYLAIDNSADLFVRLLGGEWHSDLKIPMLENKTNIIVGMMVDIMSGQYSRNCTDEEKDVIKKLLAAINSSGSYDAAIKTVYEFAFPDTCLQIKNDILSIVRHLDGSNVTIMKGAVTGINLSNLDAPEHKDMRSAFVIAALRSLCFDKTTPKILVLDEMTHMFDHPYYNSYIKFILDNAKAHNIAIIGTVDTEKYLNNTSQQNLWTTLRENLDLQIVMYHKDVLYNLQQAFGLTDYEAKKLEFVGDKRRFIMKPAGYPSIICELAISSISHVLKILSCDDSGRSAYDSIISSIGNPDDAKFLPELYKALREQK